jgi:hypothetical protein
MNEPTQEQAQQLGQDIVDLVGERCKQLGHNDLNWVLRIFVSVLGHYIGGITPLNVQQAAYAMMGSWLAECLDKIRDTGAPSAEVLNIQVDEPGEDTIQ